MTNRAELSKAWGEGFTAGNSGKSRAANPYIAKDSALAKEWDSGWKESTAT